GTPADQTERSSGPVVPTGRERACQPCQRPAGDVPMGSPTFGAERRGPQWSLPQTGRLGSRSPFAYHATVGCLRAGYPYADWILLPPPPPGRGAAHPRLPDIRRSAGSDTEPGSARHHIFVRATTGVVPPVRRGERF